MLESDPRVQLATERTLLAWIRTGLALMAFGFVVARFALLLQAMGVKTSPFFSVKATILGVLLVALGIIVNVIAPLHYRRYYRRIREAGAMQYSASALSTFVAYTLALIGIVLVIYLVVVDLQSWNVNGG